MVFVVGGNGGNAAANAIAEECEAQGVVCSVVGVPKSIDNDILLVSDNLPQSHCLSVAVDVDKLEEMVKGCKPWCMCTEAASTCNGLDVMHWSDRSLLNKHLLITADRPLLWF